MSNHHYQDSYKGILFNVIRRGGEYYVYTQDIKYNLNASGSSLEEAISEIKESIDNVRVC